MITAPHQWIVLSAASATSSEPDGEAVRSWAGQLSADHARVLRSASDQTQHRWITAAVGELGPLPAHPLPAVPGSDQAWGFTALTALRLNPDAGPADQAHELMLVLNNAAAGREADLDAWYDQRHIGDTFRVLETAAVRRYAAASPASPYGRLAIYAIPNEVGSSEVATRIAGAQRERAEAVLAGRVPQMPLSDAMGESYFSDFYRMSATIDL